MSEHGALRRLVSEVRRRKVRRAAVLCAVGGLATVEAAALVFPRLQLADWTVTLVLALVLVGFPLALAVAWIFEIRPGGIVRTSDAPSAGATVAARPPAPRHRVAILPFASI